MHRAEEPPGEPLVVVGRYALGWTESRQRHERSTASVVFAPWRSFRLGAACGRGCRSCRQVA